MNHADGTESVLIGNWHARLPSAICTDPAIFNSIFSVDTWENVLGSEAKQRILQMLPKEILRCQGLGVQTIHDLLSGELSRFSSTPLETFFNQLDGGLFEPSVVPTKEAIKKVWRKDTKRIIKKRQIKVLQELLVSRTKFFDSKFPPNVPQSNGFGGRDSISSRSNKDTGNGSNMTSRNPGTQIQNPHGVENELQRKARKRFLSELSEINAQGNCASSDDEEFPVSKKPTRHTYSHTTKLKKEMPESLLTQKAGTTFNKPCSTPGQSLGLNSSGSHVSLHQQHSNTSFPARPSTVKPAARPTNLKPREEQTTVQIQLAKFPKILPAPMVGSPTETQSKPVTDMDAKTSAGVASSSSQFKSSPLLASQLQAPIVSCNKQSSHSDNFLANRMLQISRGSSSFSHTPFSMTPLDELDSSSDDEFESIEPTIGFANSSSPGARSYSPKSGTKGPKGRGIQNSKSKSKTSNAKQQTPNIKAVPSVSSVLSTPVSSTLNVSSHIPANAGSITRTPQALLQNQGPILVGLTSSSSSSTHAAGIRLQPPPILLTNTNVNNNPIVIPALASSSSESHSTVTNTPPTIKLTPRLVTTAIGTNKLLSALTPGTTQDRNFAYTSAASVIRPVSSFNVTSTPTAMTGNSNVILLNGPTNKGTVTMGGQNDGAKNLPANVFRIHCGTSSQSFITSVNTSTPIMSKQNLTMARITGSLGQGLGSPITLQDLNFSLNSDGNVVHTYANTTEQKLLSESAEDKIDDLSVLDGNPFDSIPNLSDELDGFDLDLVEVCDFHSLVSEEKHYASFFSLIRDVLCSTKDHRMTLVCLEKTIRKWSISASAQTNSWFTQVADWNEALTTALNFLAGNYQDAHPEEFVPYIEYKYKTKYYQWIGAGRDSDNNMLPLCNMWLENLGRLPPIKKLETEPDEPEEDDDDNEDSDSPDVEIKKKPKRPITPPPPRCVTTWTVRPSNEEEREYFQEQERQRFENPHKAFTYRMHDYESVVGPVKGVYSSQSGVTNKARGHSLLIDDRPPYVTILALVRDAVARLPNGEGTRSEICEMLRDSAFLAPEASNITLNSVVSGALDRLHYERDPCVRYDSHKKSWIYLHRDRNQDQFERLHHNRSYTKSTKSRSNTSRKARKHNKSTSSSGSQSHGQITTPNSSPTNSDLQSSGVAATSVVKLPPIETMLGKPLSQSSPSDKVVILPTTSKALSQGGSKTYSVTSNPGSTSTATTLLAAQLSKPLINTTASTNSAIQLTASISTPALPTSQANISTGQLMLGGNNVVRLGGQLRFSPVRVPVSAAAFQSAGLRLSPRIVLRGGPGGVPVQNQGLIFGQTPDGQTIIFQASPGSGVGAMQVQLSSPASGQPQPANHAPFAVVNSSESIQNPTAGSSSIRATVSIPQPGNNKGQDSNLVASKVSSSPINASGQSQVQVVSSQSQISKQSTTISTNSTVATSAMAQTSPILIKSSQGNFIVPARIYGTGPVGEFKMVPLPGAGNQTVYARIVPQSSDLTSAPAVRFVTTTAASQNTPSSSSQ